MGELQYRADSLADRLKQTIQILSDQKDKLGSWTGDLKSLAEAAEKIEEENKRLADENKNLLEQNKKLQADLAGAKK